MKRGPKDRSLQQQTADFWARVDKAGACWPWTGCVSGPGYGVMRFSGKNHLAHRLAWEFTNGPVADGLCVLHNCPSGDNPKCCNPGHLFLGTRTDNAIDKVSKGRQGKGAKNGGAVLTENHVLLVRHLRKSTTLGQREVAVLFRVSQQTVYDIEHRRTWAHVAGEALA